MEMLERGIESMKCLIELGKTPDGLVIMIGKELIEAQVKKSRLEAWPDMRRSAEFRREQLERAVEQVTYLKALMAEVKTWA